MDSILTQGDPRLKQSCVEVQLEDPTLPGQIERLQQVLGDFQLERGYGRAIAAPQIGILKRFLCVNLGATPFVLINPEVTWKSEATLRVWDDCLSLPEIVVEVVRYRSISLVYYDEEGRQRSWERLSEEMSELLQHEIDHLDGILMTDRAVGPNSVRPIREHAGLVGEGRRKHRLSLSAISQAAHSVDPVFLGSPQFVCEPLSETLGCTLTLKIETMNPIRCFKGRGADYFLQKVVSEKDSRALVCASAGNFGQALAYSCRSLNRQLVIYAATTANRVKIERMQDLGAEVRLVGSDFDSAKAAAREWADTHGAWMVEDGLEPEISEGAGTIAIELLAHGALYDDVIVPVGNGALINGVGRWIKASSPSTRVVGVCAAGADSMAQSWRLGEVVETEYARTLADGIAVRVPIPESVADMEGLVDEILLVDEDAIEQAQSLLLHQAGVVVEPAGCVTVAALLNSAERFRSRQVATVITGSNLA